MRNTINGQVKSYTVETDANGSYSLLIGYQDYYFTVGVYEFWASGKDLDNVSFVTPKLLLSVVALSTKGVSVYLPPTPQSRGIVTIRAIYAGKPVNVTVEDANTGLIEISVLASKDLFNVKLEYSLWLYNNNSVN